MLFLETRPKEEGSNGKPLSTLEGHSPVLANTHLETILLYMAYWCHNAAPFGKMHQDPHTFLKFIVPPFLKY